MDAIDTLALTQQEEQERDEPNQGTCLHGTQWHIRYGWHIGRIRQITDKHAAEAKALEETRDMFAQAFIHTTVERNDLQKKAAAQEATIKSLRRRIKNAKQSLILKDKENGNE